MSETEENERNKILTDDLHIGISFFRYKLIRFTRPDRNEEEKQKRYIFFIILIYQSIKKVKTLMQSFRSS